jgi:Group II intron, maturase-specific domain
MGHHWDEVRPRLTRFLGGWCHYYRHGQSYQAFKELDEWVEERVARHLARSQPHTQKRRRRRWTECLDWLQEQKVIPKLNDLKRTSQAAHRGQANVRWRAG